MSSYKQPKYDFNNPEDFKKLEIMAYDATIDIENFPPAAYRYFHKLTKLYEKFKHENFPKEEAKKMKASIYSDYRFALEAHENWFRTHAAYQENIRKAGELLSKIEKSSDVAEIAMLACEAVGLMTGDDGFYIRQVKKLKGVCSDD